MGSRSKALLTAALLVLLLPGCGGDSQSTSTTNSTRASQPPATTAPPQNLKPPTTPRPDPQSGSKAAAPGVPTSKEGDNSIQVYGVEAGDAERAMLTTLVQTYFDARAAGSWTMACSLLAAKTRAEYLRFAPDAKSCAEAAAFFAKDADPVTLRKEAQIEVLSLRLDSRFAFLIYRRPDGIWAMALEREGGKWKVTSVAPAPVG